MEEKTEKTQWKNVVEKRKQNIRFNKIINRKTQKNNKRSGKKCMPKETENFQQFLLR